MRSKGRLLAVAGVMGLALPFLAATPASARVLQRCDYHGRNCVRVICDHRDNERCWIDSRYGRMSIYQHPGYWQCNRDRCWYKYTALNFGDDRRDRHDDTDHHGDNDRHGYDDHGRPHDYGH